MPNHFELFGLPPRYALEREALEQAYRDLQARVHPDRYAAAGDADRRASLQLATRVNEAYRTLKDPVQRARHLLELHGVDAAFETDTQMPTDFLLQQLDLREELEGAIHRKDSRALDALRARLDDQKKVLESELRELLDEKNDYRGAVDAVRKLMFLARVDAEVDEAYEDVT